jgi:hypothetical protein
MAASPETAAVQGSVTVIACSPRIQRFRECKSLINSLLCQLRMRALLRLGIEDSAKFIAETGKLLPQEFEIEQKTAFGAVWQAIADGKFDDKTD